MIQGKRLDAETRAQLRDLGADEDGVWVPADVIERIPGRRLMGVPITDAEFGYLLRTFERYAFRFETQPAYALDYEQADFDRFLAGNSPSLRPRWAGGGHGSDQIRNLTRQGRLISRVRVHGRAADRLPAVGTVGRSRGRATQAST